MIDALVWPVRAVVKKRGRPENTETESKVFIYIYIYCISHYVIVINRIYLCIFGLSLKKLWRGCIRTSEVTVSANRFCEWNSAK